MRMHGFAAGMLATLLAAAALYLLGYAMEAMSQDRAFDTIVALLLALASATGVYRLYRYAQRE